MGVRQACHGVHVVVRLLDAREHALATERAPYASLPASASRTCVTFSYSAWSAGKDAAEMVPLSRSSVSISRHIFESRTAPTLALVDLSPCAARPAVS